MLYTINRLQKKLIYLLLVICLMLSIGFTATKNVYASTRSDIEDENNYCTVRIDPYLIKKRGKQYAKVKLKVYYTNPWGKSKSKRWKVTITLTDENGKFLKKWTGRGDDTLKLGDDHISYRIYVRELEQNSFWRRVEAYSFDHPIDYWEFTNSKNCTIS